MFLEIPWEDSRYLKSKYPNLRPMGGSMFVYPGNPPKELSVYKTEDFSYARWIEDEYRIKNSEKPLSTVRGSSVFTPREHQMVGAKKIYSSWSSGWSGFLLADETGLGKGLLETTLIPTPDGFKKMKDIEIGDVVFDDHGRKTNVTEKKLSNASKFFEITFSDGSVVYADADHRWMIHEKQFSKSTNNHSSNNFDGFSVLNFVKKYEQNLTCLKNFLKHCEVQKTGTTLDACVESFWKNNNSNCANTNKETNKEVFEFFKNLFANMKSVGSVHENINVFHPQEILEKFFNIFAFDKTLNNNGLHQNSFNEGFLLMNTNQMFDMFQQNKQDTNKNFENDQNFVNHAEIEMVVENLKNIDNNAEIFKYHGDFTARKVDNKSRNITKNRCVIDIKETEKLGEYYCLGVDSDTHMYLCTESFIPTHNTLTTLTAVTAIAKKSGATKDNKKTLLVVCPKGVIPQWRQTIRNYPASTINLRIMVINYQQLNKLIESPEKAKQAKRARTKNRNTAAGGKPKFDFDFVVFDESHALKNYPSSSTSLAAVNIAKLNSAYVKGKSPFVVFSTATPGSSPLNFSVMSGFLARLVSDSPSAKTVFPSQWGDFLANQGFSVKKGKSGYTWASVPWFGKNSDKPEERAKYEKLVKQSKLQQRKDAVRIGKALSRPIAPFLKRSPKDIAGWPEQQIIPMPLELSAKQRPVYEEAWSRFRRWLKLTPAKSDPKGALVENLRYMQKCSLLQVEPMIDPVVEWVDDGKQVYIAVQFMETLDAYKTRLAEKKIPCVEISGRNVKERENERIRFQKGLAKVVLCTVTSGISLHADEILPDGTKASSNERISIIHDLRNDPNQTGQSLGRAHRDGVNSLTYIPYFEDTVGEKTVNSFINKFANMKSMLGESKNEVDYLEEVFREAAMSKNE